MGGDKTKSGENASKSGKGDEKIALPDGTLWDGLGSWEGLGEGLSGVRRGAGCRPERSTDYFVLSLFIVKYTIFV